jgi:hypothetical protein
VGDLRGIDRGGRAHVDHAERGDQHAGIGVGGRVGGRERIGDIAVVVGIEQSVGEDVAQKPLIEMVVRIDEAGQHDPVGGIDHRRVVTRKGDVRAHLANLAALDEHVGLGEIADLPIEGEHDAALEQDAPRPLHAGEQAISVRRGSLRVRLARQHLRRGCAAGKSSARGQQPPARKRSGRRSVRCATARIGCCWRGGVVMAHCSLLPTHAWTRAVGSHRFSIGR